MYSRPQFIDLTYMGDTGVDDDYFWWYYLELVDKTKYQMWCKSDVPSAQDPSYRFDLYGGGS